MQQVIYSCLIILLIILLFYLYIKINENIENNIEVHTEKPRNPYRPNLIRIRISRPRIKNVPIKDNKNPNKYYESIQEHDNDSQNVHNSQIITDLKKKYKRLVELTDETINQCDKNNLLSAGITEQDVKESRIAQMFNELRIVISKNEQDNIKQNLSIVLNEISAGHSITSISYEIGSDKEPIPVNENW